MGGYISRDEEGGHADMPEVPVNVCAVGWRVDEAWNGVGSEAAEWLGNVYEH